MNRLYSRYSLKKNCSLHKNLTKFIPTKVLYLTICFIQILHQQQKDRQLEKYTRNNSITIPDLKVCYILREEVGMKTDL